MPSEWSGGHIFRIYSTLERHLERHVSKQSISKILELCITRVKKKDLINSNISRCSSTTIANTQNKNGQKMNSTIIYVYL